MPQPRSQVQVSFVEDHSVEETAVTVRARGRNILIASVLLALVVVVYAMSVRFGFVYTDRQEVTQNLALRTWRSGLGAIWLSPGATPHYSPLAYTVLLAEGKLGRDRASRFHAASVLVHAVNVILLWILLRKLMVPGAPWLAAIFAVHPLQIEAVAWISQQRILLCSSFYLMGLIVWHRSLGAAVACALAAMLCHPFGATFPLAAGLLFRPIGTRRSLWLGLLLGAGIAVICLEILAHSRSGAVAPDRFVSSIAVYLVHIVYPWGLPTAERFDAALYLLLGGIFAAGAVWLHRRLPPIPNWLGPAAGVTCVIGLAALSAVQLPAFRDAPSLWTHVLKHNPDSLVALNEMGSFELNEAKSPQRAIGQFARAVSVDPTDWRTLFNLGRAHAAAGEYDRAIMRYQEVLSRQPDDVDVRFQLAIAYASQNRRADAVREMEQVIRARPGFAEAYVQLGTFLADLGNFKPAADAMKEAIRLDPRDPTAYIMLAWLAYTQFNDPVTAEGLLVQARKLDLRKPETVLLAGDILFELSKQEKDPQKRENKFQTTVYYYREGVRLLPDSASPYKRLGIALGALSQAVGQPDQAVDCLNEAILCFERVALLDRDDPEATRFREDAVRQRDALVRKIR